MPLEIETQLNKVPETQIQRKPSRWSTPIIHQKREDLLTRQPDPIEKQKLTLTPDIEALVKKFYEGMKHVSVHRQRITKAQAVCFPHMYTAVDLFGAFKQYVYSCVNWNCKNKQFSK